MVYLYVCMWRSENDLQGSVLFLHHVSPVRRYPYLLSHLVNSQERLWLVQGEQEHWRRKKSNYYKQTLFSKLPHFQEILRRGVCLRALCSPIFCHSKELPEISPLKGERLDFIHSLRDFKPQFPGHLGSLERQHIMTQEHAAMVARKESQYNSPLQE